MNKKFKVLILIASVLGFIAVGMGAFGAHILRDKISPESMIAYKTAVNYQIFHALAIFAVAFLYRIYRIKGLFIIGLYFFAGIFLFSGSIYLLSLKTLLGIESLNIIGILTPIGGIGLLIGWASIFFTVIKIKT